MTIKKNKKGETMTIEGVAKRLGVTEEEVVNMLKDLLEDKAFEERYAKWAKENPEEHERQRKESQEHIVGLMASLGLKDGGTVH